MEKNCDYKDRIQIAKDCNRKHPHRVIEFTQDMHFDWERFLNQLYVKGRDDMDGVVGRILGARWRRYGANEMRMYPPDDGEPRVELVEHPGEVWIRYSLDDTEPWTRIEVRRACNKKYKDQYGRDKEGTVTNVGTDELPESKKEIQWNIKNCGSAGLKSHSAWRFEVIFLLLQSHFYVHK